MGAWLNFLAVVWVHKSHENTKSWERTIAGEQLFWNNQFFRWNSKTDLYPVSILICFPVQHAEKDKQNQKPRREKVPRAANFQRSDSLSAQSDKKVYCLIRSPVYLPIPRRGNTKIIHAGCEVITKGKLSS